MTSGDHHCQFPGCTRARAEGRDVCTLHAPVRMSATGSWVSDRHDSGGHG
jgi:hypothetical protein